MGMPLDENGLKIVNNNNVTVFCMLIIDTMVSIKVINVT